MAKSKELRTPAQQAKHDRNREANDNRAAFNYLTVNNLNLYGDKRPSKLVRQYKRTQAEGYAQKVKAAETERKKIEQKAKDDAAREKRKADAKAKRENDAVNEAAVTLMMLETTGR